MRSLIFILIFSSISLLANITYAQSDSSLSNQNIAAIYLNLNIGASIPYGLANGGIGANIISFNNWGGSISYDNCGWPAGNLPSDYHPGSYFFGAIHGNIPNDKLKFISLRAIKIVPTKNKLIRFGFEGGISLVLHQSAQFFSAPLSWWGSNYEVRYKPYVNTIGLSLVAKVEFPFINFFGIGLAAISNINKEQSYLGAQFCMALGKIRAE